MYTTCEVFQCHTRKNQFRVNSRDKTSGLYFKPPPHPPSPLPPPPSFIYTFWFQVCTVLCTG